jgi:hypothetical protein
METTMTTTMTDSPVPVPEFDPLWVLEQQLDEADLCQYCPPSPAMKAVLAAFDKLSDEDKLSAYVLMLRKLQEFLASDKSPLVSVPRD